MQYDGTVYGADLSEVEAHGGVSLGYETPPAPSGASGVTSVAYVPVGNGSLFYFGGALDAGPGMVNVPSGGLLLSYDVAQMLDFPYVPSSGPVTILNLDLSGFQSSTVTLGTSDRETGAALLVESQVIGSTFFEQIDQVAGAQNHTGGVHPGT
jgi:hypothetical protein